MRVFERPQMLLFEDVETVKVGLSCGTVACVRLVRPAYTQSLDTVFVSHGNGSSKQLPSSFCRENLVYLFFNLMMFMALEATLVAGKITWWSFVILITPVKFRYGKITGCDVKITKQSPSQCPDRRVKNESSWSRLVCKSSGYQERFIEPHPAETFGSEPLKPLGSIQVPSRNTPIFEIPSDSYVPSLPPLAHPPRLCLVWSMSLLSPGTSRKLGRCVME